MIDISFLIPVYNQSEDLRKCISSIVPYKGDDIEIVVNDDCSTEELSFVVDSFKDDRIRLCRNPQNLGLDGNILSGMQNCRGRYIFLLRTRDLVIAESIPDILFMVRKNPGIVYLTGTCLDDDGLPRLFYKNRICLKGEAALNIHDSIHFHPSGSLFKKEAVDICKYQRYLNRFSVPKLWFMVDHLIRLELTQKGEFGLISKPIWIYTYTNRNQKKSVHPIKGGHLYTQKNILLRFQSEMEFVFDEFEGELRIRRYINAFKMWLLRATWGYLDTMSDKALMKHYGIEPEKVDIRAERKRFLHFAKKIESDLGVDDGRYFQAKEEAILKNIEYEKQKDKTEFAQMFVRKISYPVISEIEEMRFAGNSLAVYLTQNGFNRIGIYGMGYLGRIVWNELMNSNKVKVVFISDKMYEVKMPISHDSVAIPTNKIDDYDIDVLLVTPIQHKDEILREISCKAPRIVISDLLQNKS